MKKNIFKQSKKQPKKYPLKKLKNLFLVVLKLFINPFYFKIYESVLFQIKKI